MRQKHRILFPETVESLGFSKSDGLNIADNFNRGKYGRVLSPEGAVLPVYSKKKTNAINAPVVVMIALFSAAVGLVALQSNLVVTVITVGLFAVFGYIFLSSRPWATMVDEKKAKTHDGQGAISAEALLVIKDAPGHILDGISRKELYDHVATCRDFQSKKNKIEALNAKTAHDPALKVVGEELLKQVCDHYQESRSWLAKVSDETTKYLEEEDQRAAQEATRNELSKIKQSYL